MDKITDMAAWKASHVKPIADACRWPEAVEAVLATNLRILFAWQRVALRSIWRL